MTEAIVEETKLGSGMAVLDLASGTGDPALTLARLVAPRGRVIATDLSQGILDIAEMNARNEGLENIAFQQADAELLPFPDVSFDAVISRIGVMYFVDVQRARRDPQGAQTGWTGSLDCLGAT